NIWNEDAYNYYVKRCKQAGIDMTISYELFVSIIKGSKDVSELYNDSVKSSQMEQPMIPKNYTLGDCGAQYGELWRSWPIETENGYNFIDQLDAAITSLNKNPMSRRHIVT